MFYPLNKINTVTRKLTKRFRGNSRPNFLSDERGTVAVIFGLTLIPIMLSAGIAVDYSRIAHTRGVIDEALDAAVLMSTKSMAKGATTNTAFRAKFEDFLYANINGRTNLASNIEVEEFRPNPVTGKIFASVRTNVKMAFLGIIGKNSVDIVSRSEAVMSSKKVELAMMLDVTGSMNSQGKIAALKLAANDAIDILMPGSSVNNNVRISLVPYSSGVNIGRSLARIASNSPRNKCATERYSNRYNDASYATTRVEGRSGNCPRQQVIPLSSSPSTLKSAISGLSASGSTAGHLGVAWSYYTLSPSWNNAWPASTAPVNYNDTKVQKIALLMTDGEFNTVYTRGLNSADFAISTCASMKRDDILIYSVAFKAPRSAQATLRSCASADTAETQFYYSADSASALKAAFAEIANDIRRIRLSQ